MDDDEGLERLIQVWKDGSADLDSRLAVVERRIMAELARPEIDANVVYRLGLQKERIGELQGVAGAIIDDLTTSTERFLQGGGLDRIYAAGAGVAHQAAGSLPFSFTAPHRAAVDVMAQDLFDDVLQATSFVEDGLKDYVRRVGRALTGFRLTGGTPVKAQARGLRDQLRAEFGRHGATAVTYRDGSRHAFGEYAEMLLRTKCLPPTAPVDSARVLGVTRHWHEGPWVTVRTASGVEISGTPNHPVLTVAGWKGLGQLAEGDKLIRHAADVKTECPAADVHVGGRQATIREVFDALQDSGHVERAPAVQVDFHGDRPNHDVDVVRADGVLLVGEFAPVSKRSGYVGLEPADLGRVAVDAFRYRFTHGDGIDGCHCLAGVSPPDSGLIETFVDRSDCASVLVGQARGRSSRLVRGGDDGGWQIDRSGMAGGCESETGGVAPESGDSGASDDVADGGGVDPALPCDRGASLAAAVVVDDVESVGFGQWSGHVYNLHTLDGYWWSDGLATGNTGIAYNMGTLNSSRLLGIEVFEILDGAECGLVAHHDPELANGRIVTLEFAIAYPLSHPNCRRAIAPRPDLKGVDDPNFQSVQAPEARDDQAAFEKALRQQQEARQATGRQGRTGRAPRASRTAGGGTRTARAPRAARGAPAARPGQVGPRLTPEQEAARADRLRRREYVQRTKEQAAAARDLERLAAARQRAKAAGFRGEVDPDILRRWQISEEQFLNARAIVGDIKADVRQAAKAQADELGGWLFDNELDHISRPERLVRRTDLITSESRFVRTQGGYDWLEQLDDAELARVRGRMVDGDLYRPDVLADVIRSKTGQDFTDDEAMGWLVDRWLQEDGLRSVASGRLPKYAEANNLLPADQALEGYRLDQLFGVEVDDAAGHVATVQAEAAAREAASLLGTPRAGPAPWEMDFPEYLRDLEQVEDILGRTQLAPGIDPGEAFAYARARISELAPPGIDPDGNLNPVELFERIRITAQNAGMPTSG